MGVLTGMDFSRTSELHSHLYGALKTEHLEVLAARKEPRWNIFRESYRRTYDQEPELQGLFSGTPEARERLRAYHLYTTPGNFTRFQTAFDLVISVAHLDADEIYLVCDLVLEAQQTGHAEYRMLFPERSGLDGFAEWVRVYASALRSASANHPGKEARAVISLHRSDSAGVYYSVLRELMDLDPVVADVVVGIDYCAEERGHPPREKAGLLQRILHDNRVQPKTALAILYHVGESFDDKTLQSAIRWVLEAAQMGAHRLGHAIAPGIQAEDLAGTIRVESVQERIDQILFEKRHCEELKSYGYACGAGHTNQANRELDDLLRRPASDQLEFYYDDIAVERYLQFQAFALNKLKEIGTVIESCPTSNLRIAGLGSLEKHPLGLYVNSDLPVVIGTDDAGVLDTDMPSEAELAHQIPGMDAASVERLLLGSVHYRSEVVSGRW